MLHDLIANCLKIVISVVNLIMLSRDAHSTTALHMLFEHIHVFIKCQ